MGHGHTGTGSGAGGNGVVFVRMPTASYAARSAITGTYTTSTDGDDTIIKWTASPATFVT